MEFIKEINVYFEVWFKNEDWFNSNDFSISDNFLDDLIRIYKILNDKIKDKQRSKGIDYGLENSVASISKLIAKTLYDNINFVLKEKEKFRVLCENKYIGFGFYSSNIIDDFLKHYDEFKSILYKSLATYFNEYYGYFSDNELAIEMLCEYFPRNLELNDDTKEILVSALYMHCSNAGEPSDGGFAFGGIQKIREGFPKLSQDIVIKVIEKYSYNEVWYQPVYRKQIYTMIDSCTSEGNINKEQLKFFYIDGVMLIQQISIIINRMNEEKKEFRYMTIENKRIAENKTEIFNLPNKSIYWINEKNNFYKELVENNDRVIAKVELIKNETTEKYNIIVTAEDKKQVNLDYSYKDYTLNQYNYLNVLKQLEEILVNNEINIYNNKFLFSHIWIDNYRKIKNRQLSFDKKFKINFDNNSLNIYENDDVSKLSKDFFDKNIYSLSAIVGKNGTGKTSIIQFLRDRFFDLLSQIDTNMIHINDGVVKEKEESDEKYFIIFYIDENAYYITNFENVNLLTQKVEAYKGKTLRRNREKSRIIYFSNMIDADPTKDKLIKVDDKEILTKQALIFPSFIDYSENESYIQKSIEYNKFYDNLNKTTKYERDKTKNENVYLNIDFWYKIAFLSEYKDVDKIFGKKFTRNNIKCETYNIELNRKINDILRKDNNNLIEDIIQISKEKLTSTIIKFENLSAGQNAKFSFLSKLYWCLDGYNTYHDKIEQIIGQNAFNINDTIVNDSTAIIFIDEGEAFYHPEWQQEYISKLIEFIKTYTEGKNVKIQIVITSNSPFIISDIPRENIVFLPEEMETKEQTFAANIYNLCRSSFFLNSNNYGVIGDFATDKIDKVEEILSEMLQRLEVTDKDKEKNIQNLENSNQNIKKADKNKLKECRFIIDIIGEKFVKRSLMKLYNEVYSRLYSDDRNLNIDELEKLKKSFRILSKEEQDDLIRYIIKQRD